MVKTQKRNRMKYLSEDTVSYMNNIWGFNCTDQVDDMAMFWECGEYEMVALRLVEAGAVEPNCKEAREMIAVQSAISSRTQTRIINKCLKNYRILECSNCNHVHFIGPYCDVNDWIEGDCNSCGIHGGVKEVTND